MMNIISIINFLHDLQKTRVFLIAKYTLLFILRILNQFDVNLKCDTFDKIQLLFLYFLHLI